jgi:hypothetical protein
MTVFKNVKQLLDAQIAAWTQQKGRAPDLTGKHHDTSFKWDTLANLKAAKVVKGGKTYPLIDTTKIGQNGEGAKMNLVVALANSNGVDGWGQMPDQGPYMTSDKIKQIADWIDAGCPE